MLELDQDGLDLADSSATMAGKESALEEIMTLQETLREGNSQVGALQRHLQEISRQKS